MLRRPLSLTPIDDSCALFIPVLFDSESLSGTIQRPPSVYSDRHHVTSIFVNMLRRSSGRGRRVQFKHSVQYTTDNS